MPRNKRTYDVFLSYSSDLGRQAKVLAQKFAESGLAVFNIAEVAMGEKVGEEIWKALAESWAMVVLVGPGTTPPSVAVEIGAASAWHKPIYVLTESKTRYQAPLHISRCEVFEISDADRVVELVAGARNPLSDDVRSVLVRDYSKLGVPTDVLLRDPALIEQLRNSIKAQVGVNLSGERIMQELLRLRKRGKLPRLQRKGNT
jgi:hypothetical protein